MKSLDKYVKNNGVKKIDSVQTTVNIERRHKKFIDTNHLNLSDMVRDMLDGIIEKFKSGENKNEKVG